VGTDTAKEDVFTSLRVHNPGSQYTHFSEALDGEYFRQLTAEKFVITKKDFQTVGNWVKTGERNEALDCAVYARAAVSVRRPNFRKIARSLFRTAEKLRLEREAAGMQRPRPLRSTSAPFRNRPKAKRRPIGHRRQPKRP